MFSNVQPPQAVITTDVCCSCKGMCKRGCACQIAGTFCGETCQCKVSKCANRAGPEVMDDDVVDVYASEFQEACEGWDVPVEGPAEGASAPAPAAPAPAAHRGLVDTAASPQAWVGTEGAGALGHAAPFSVFEDEDVPAPGVHSCNSVLSVSHGT